MPVRNIINYNPQSLTAIDFTTLEDRTLYSIPMRLFLFDNALKLTIEVYEEESFNEGLPSDSRFNRVFEMNYAETKTAFPDFFAAIEEAFFDWLGISSDDFRLEMLDINLTNLKFRGKAQHKTKANREVSDETTSYEEFETVKTTYPDLGPAYYAFARTYAAINNAKLARFS